MRLKTLLIIVCLAIFTIPIGIIAGIQDIQSQSIFLIGLIFLVTFGVSFTISYLITRPIEKLTENIDKISKGKLDVHLESSEIYEINNLIDSLNRVMASLKLAIHKVGVKKGEIFDDVVKAKEDIEKKQENFLDNIIGWAWEIDAKGVYTYCSGNILNILGYEPHDMIGKSFFDIILVDDVKKTKNIFNEAIKNKKQIKNLERWDIKKNGEKVCVITNGVPFFDETGNLLGYRGIDSDNTREKITESKITLINKELADLKIEFTQILNEREEQVGKRLESTGINAKKFGEKWSEQKFDSVFIFDENANILDCNENMHKRLGYSKSEMLLLNMTDFDVLETKKDIINKINKAKKDGTYSFKTIHKRKDGSAILVFENLQYLKDKNTFKCIIREDYTIK